MHFQTSRATITNVRSNERSSRADLAQCLNAFQMGQMFFGSEFPNKPFDFHAVTDKFLEHCAGKIYFIRKFALISLNSNFLMFLFLIFSGTDCLRSVPENFSSNSVNEMIRQLSRDFLWTEAKDVWCCSLEPVWGDFLGARAVGQNRPVPFIDAFPLTLWIHMNEPHSGSVKSGAADIHGLAYISNLISVQINHYQFLFLMRLLEMISELTTYLSIDSNKVLKVESGGKNFLVI